MNLSPFEILSKKLSEHRLLFQKNMETEREQFYIEYMEQ